MTTLECCHRHGLTGSPSQVSHPLHSTALPRHAASNCCITLTYQAHSSVVNVPCFIADLPGFTRSVYERDHALVTPESRVFQGVSNWCVP